MRIQKDLRCETRDGVELAADVYLPDEPGEYPALLAYSPYGKDLQDAVLFLPRQSREESTMWDGTIEAGDIEFITDNGYAHVIADVRGTGDSGGQAVGFFDRAGQDGYDLVEWIAEQPWCDGQVGGVGRSWFGTNQLLLAAANPPSLVGVFPSGVFTDLYREFAYHGGVLNMFLYGLWDGRHGDSGIVDADWVSRERHENSPEAFEALLAEALEDPDVRQYPNLYQLLNYPEKNPLFVDLVLNDTDSEFYAERSPHERLADVECPIYLSGAWGGTHAGPVYTADERLDVDQERILMTPPRLLERPYHEYKEELIRWYDWLTKGEDTGIADEPPVKIYVAGADRWRFEEKLVPERTEWTELFFRNHGRLLPDPEPVASVPPRGFTQDPPNVSDELGRVRYRTEPLAEAREFTGPGVVSLYASIDAPDTTWIVYLHQLSGDERETLSRGYLRASHRELDPERSTPHRPYHTHRDPEPVTPGEVYGYRIPLAPTAVEVPKGDRLELEVRSMEIPFAETSDLPPGSHHLPHAETISHKIYADAERPSGLTLPEIPSTDPEQWIDPGDEAHPGPVR
ncbi:MAG: CocE/NonD family hydrolase [Haloferacaceae archaeon]